MMSIKEVKGAVIFFICFLFLIPICLLGQEEVRGKITSATGETLIGASVYIPELKKGAVSDVNGFYVIKVEAGEYNLKASMIGYNPNEKSITVSKEQNTVQNFVLVEKGRSLDEIVVTGTRTRKTQRETPASVTIMSEQKLLNLQSNAQADILRYVPGIHAEAGGGEVASNIFVRGMPSGGQLQYVSLQLDGMPLESTFGMTSSASDVYFRTDLGIEGLEFLRGGASTLFGVGAVAGIINYKTKLGGLIPQTMVKYRTEISGEGPFNTKQRADFYTGGPISKEDQLFYSFSGFYRFDDGPIYTGLETKGFQVRGAISKVTETAVYKVIGQYIDDKVQFFLPIPLDGISKTRVPGNDGQLVYSFQTEQAAHLSYDTPVGRFETNIQDGVVTKGGLILVDVSQKLGEDRSWEFNSKLKYAQYDHRFNLFITGDGDKDSPNIPETQAEYADRYGISNYTYTYVDNGEKLPPGDIVFANRIFDRSRPFFELAGDANIIKILDINNDHRHNIALGFFGSRMEVGDFNVFTRYLAEFNNVPRLVNLSYTLSDDGGDQIRNFTDRGIVTKASGYVNKKLQSSKFAIYLTDEMVFFDALRIDVGFRYEWHWGSIQNELTSKQKVLSSDSLITWGNKIFDHHNVNASDWALALAASYDLGDHSIYGNFSRGFYFSSLRTLDLRTDENDRVYPSLKSEQILQAEIGWKFQLDNQLLATVAAYYVGMFDRTDVTYTNSKDGIGIDESATIFSTRTFGIEATLLWNIFPEVIPGLSLEGSFTYQNHQTYKFEEKGKRDPSKEGKLLRRQPTVLGNLGLRYSSYGFDAGYSISIEGSAYSDDANTNLLPSHENSRLDLAYTFDLNLGGENHQQTLRVGAGVYNLFGSTAVTEGDPRQIGTGQTATSSYFVGRPSLPRRFYVEATFTF